MAATPAQTEVPASAGVAHEPAREPDVFAVIPGGFFAPLAGPSRALYVSVLQAFYAREYESVSGVLLKDDAIEVAEDLLVRHPLWAENRAGAVASLGEDAPVPVDEVEEEVVRRRASRYLVQRLHATGWFHFEYRSDQGGEVVSFYPYASRFLTTIVQVARGEQPVLEGYTHDIATMLEPKTFAKNPGVSLARVRQSTLEFVRELKTLERNIYAATRTNLERASSAGELLQEAFDHYQRLGGDNYHRLKTSENYYRVQRDILVRLDEIERDFQGLALEHAARWAAGQVGSGENAAEDLERGRQYVRDALALVRAHLTSLPGLIADIDQRHARFRGVARRKLGYLLRQEQDAGARLTALLEAFTASGCRDLPVALYRPQFLGPAGPDGRPTTSLFTPRAQRAAPASQAMPELHPPSRESQDRQVRAIIAAMEFTPPRLEHFVAGLMGSRPRMDVTLVPLRSDLDYARLIHISHHGFAKESAYRFTPVRCSREPCLDPACEECHARVGPYRVPRGVIERRRGPTPG